MKNRGGLPNHATGHGVRIHPGARTSGRVCRNPGAPRAPTELQDYGTPQHRPRLFIVGIRLDVYRGFQWPRPSGRISLEECLEPHKAPAHTLPDTLRTNSNVQEALLALEDAGHRPQQECFVVNAHGSPSRIHWMKDRSPCITADRGARQGHAWGHVRGTGRRPEQGTASQTPSRRPPRQLVGRVRSRVSELRGGSPPGDRQSPQRTGTG